MNAIVPLNIAAIRVNNNDNTNIVSQLQGKTGLFEKMPWNNGSFQNEASTGDKIFSPLSVTAGGAPGNSPADPLDVGVHLHWELPDYFRKGKQPLQGGNLVFPHAPNRWMVVRYLSMFNAATQTYGPVTGKSWIVESDYLSSTLSVDPNTNLPRPAITVPIAVPGEAPFMYMGRVVDYNTWNPSAEPASNYLPHYNGEDGSPLYLTSIGFVGSYFGSYYPECRSVFGFWDNFADVPQIYAAITQNTPVRFRATYQVIGWINETNADPLSGIVSQVTTQYNDYLAKCNANAVPPQKTPTDFFGQIASQNMKWSFNMADVSCVLNEDHTIQSLSLPQQTLCAGTVQEVVWDMDQNPGTTFFLKSGGTNPAVWPAETEIAIGNSTEEAIAALLKYDMGQKSTDPDVLTNYEYLLDALQLGLLADLENTPNKLITLEEALHNNGFSAQAGGYLWIISKTQNPDSTAPPDPNAEITLPLQIAELLSLLNQAQKNYDMGRAALALKRKQLFMDWTRYIKIYMGETPDPNINTNSITNFLYTSSGGELTSVINEGNRIGILLYSSDVTSGAVTGMLPPAVGGAASLANAAWAAYQSVLTALNQFNASNTGNNFVLQCAQAPAFYTPSEPILLMEGDMMEPVQRNGTNKITSVRLSPELLNQLTITSGSSSFTVTTSSLAGVPVVSSVTPMPMDVQTLLAEAFLITPMLTAATTSALAAQGGANNPAVLSAMNFTITLMSAQGGLSPLEILPSPGGVPSSTAASLFSTVRSSNYKPVANNSIAIASPQQLTFVFTNATANGWSPDPIGWNCQEASPEFQSQRLRVDPFLPIFMIWNLQLNPLLCEQDADKQLYSSTNLTDYFNFDTDAVDYQYNTAGGKPVNFTSPISVPYGNPSTMSSNSGGVLLYQIQNFIGNHPGDDQNKILQEIADLYSTRKFLSQSISGFNGQQLLTSLVAQIPVQNLVKSGRDSITTRVAQAAGTTLNDDWYDFGFNSLAPIATGLQAQGNFGPLRAGMMEILSIEIVDAFGQRMDLFTDKTNPDGSLNCITSYSMTPQAADTANTGKIYLAPRVLAPTRLWFRWLSATFDPGVPGITGDFVEMNSHPATSPVCGWVVPNHLDNNLFFYDADGSAIGSFGVEHSATKPAVVYRTRAGNPENPQSLLSIDIGTAGSPTVNVSLANYMWYINAQTPQFLEDLMTSVQNSDLFINPANYAQDASLSVLIGRPLALTRAVIGLETAGNVLPLSQADNDAGSPFPQDVNNNRYDYMQRMQFSSGNLGAVEFPVRLGDLANMDDGLVGYIIEGSGSNPYLGETFYAPAATATMQSGVQQPSFTTLELTLNAEAVTVMMLVDPRAGVHATTGILPVGELSIPPDQYSATLRKLSVTFVARPMLQMAQGLVVPLPKESGYVWSWITPGATTTTPLQAEAGNETPVYGYSPQTIQEGWLELNPDTTQS